MKRILSVFLALTLMISIMGMTASAAALVVQPPTPSSPSKVQVSLYSDTKTLVAGGTLRIGSDISPRGATYDNVEWSSSDRSIAEVDANGHVTGKSPGNAVITMKVFRNDASGKPVQLGAGSVKLKIASGNLEASRINIYSGMDTVRVGRTLLLDYRVYSGDVGYDSVVWDSSDYDIAEVDEYGEVTGIAPGEVTIGIEIFLRDGNKKKVSMGTGSIKLTVLPSLVTSEDSKPKSSSSSSSASGKKSDNSFAGEKLSAAAVTSAVKKAVVKGSTASTTFKDATSVSAASLQSAAIAMKDGGGVVLLNFDTTSGTTREGRLTINPAEAGGVKGDIKLRLYTNEDATSSVKKKFEESFRNRIVVVKAEQSGSYGMSVSCAVKMGTSFVREKNLKLYSYDRSANKYNEIKDAGIWLDASGYVHFKTTVGDYLIVSNGALAHR